MENQKIKCSSQKHDQIDAISFGLNCKIYMCNKCGSYHSEMYPNHNQINLDTNLNEIFTGFCKEENHNDELLFFCRTHNQLCCSSCLCKIKKKGNGQHADCDACVIEDIKQEKERKLKENIKILENLYNTLENSINQLKNKVEEVNKKREELKLNIQKIFTKIRNTINEQEDKLLAGVDQKFDDLYFKEDILKESEKLPKRVKVSLDKVKEINKEKNKLNSFVNDCINIENNIKYINSLDGKINKCNNLNSTIQFNPSEENEINKFLEILKSFGRIEKRNGSEIISEKDIYFIIEKLSPQNELSLELLYKCDEYNDTPKIFHEKCDGKKNVLVFIETTEGIRFGGYTSIGFNSSSRETLDNNAFIFSVDKKKIYNVKKDRIAIFCKEGFGPCFCGTGNFNIYIECNHFLKGICHTSGANNNTYDIQNDYELNNSKYEFLIKKLEVFQLKIKY